MGTGAQAGSGGRFAPTASFAGFPAAVARFLQGIVDHPANVGLPSPQALAEPWWQEGTDLALRLLLARPLEGKYGAGGAEARLRALLDRSQGPIRPGRPVEPSILGLSFGEAAAAALLDALPRGSGAGSPEALGWAYEALSPFSLEGERGGSRFRLRPSRDRRGRSTYYTPGPVVRRIVQEVLQPLIEDRSPDSAPDPRALLALRVLDPAMGSGHFLLEACRHLSAAVERAVRVQEARQGFRSDGRDFHGRGSLGLPDPSSPRFSGAVRQLVAKRCLYGVDLDPLAVALAHRALSLEVFGRGPWAHPAALWNFVLGDALGDGPPEGEDAATSWFGSEGPPGFDAVLGNPPWVSFSGRQAASLSPRRRAQLQRFASFSGWESLHGPFAELSMGLLRPGGRLGLVLPAAVADLEGYGPTRAALRRLGRILEPARDLGEEGFAGVVQPAFALIAVRGAAQIVVPGPARGLVRGLVPGSDGPEADGAPIRLARTTERKPASKLRSTVLARLDQLPRPDRSSFSDVGVHTGNCSARLILSSPRPGAAPVREGRDVFAFRLGPVRRWVDLDYQASPGEYFRLGRPSACLDVPILVRQTADRPIAALHDDRQRFRNSVLACLGIMGVADALVVAWLNSTVAAWYHRTTTREAGQRAFPQVKVRHLRNLPLPPLLLDPKPARALAESLAERTVSEVDAIFAETYEVTAKELEDMRAELSSRA